MRGYWTTRGYANSRIANSRTGQVADWTTRGCHRRLCVLSFRSFGGICETASCPVRELAYPRVVQLPDKGCVEWFARLQSGRACGHTRHPSTKRQPAKTQRQLKNGRYMHPHAHACLGVLFHMPASTFFSVCSTSLLRTSSSRLEAGQWTRSTKR